MFAVWREALGIAEQALQLLVQIIEHDFGDCDLTFVDLEAPVAQVFDRLNVQLGIEQHPVVLPGLFLGLKASRFFKLAALHFIALFRRDFALFSADANALIVQYVPVEA